MFEEPLQFADINRERADKTRVCAARLADGDTGIVVFYYGRFIVLTERQALKLANRIVDKIELNRKGITNAE